MKPANTCLILGAGASKPYGYPLGEELAENIIKLGKEGRDYWAPADKIDDVKGRAWTVAEKFATARSTHPGTTIDQFLELEYPNAPKNEPTRQDWEEYSTGMMLIADVIRHCEQPKSKIVDWYQLLFEHIERSSPAEFPWPLKIITFNYDRSLEFWIARDHALKTGQLQEEARCWFSERAEIVHVYGDVGPLPDGRPRLGDFAPEYGVLRGHDFWKGRELIQTIRQRDDGNAQKYEHCQQLIRAADYVIVLGFGYDEFNCRRLALPHVLSGKYVFTTAFDGRPIGTLSNEKHYRGLKGEDCYHFLNRTKVLTWALKGWPAAELFESLIGPAAP